VKFCSTTEKTVTEMKQQSSQQKSFTSKRLKSTYGEEEECMQSFSGIQKKSDHLEEERTILKWILGTRIKGHGLHLIGLEQGQLMVGCCDHGNKASSSIQCEEFLDLLRSSYLLKEDSFP
jgi:hypothetical protein